MGVGPTGFPTCNFYSWLPSMKWFMPPSKAYLIKTLHLSPAPGLPFSGLSVDISFLLGYTIIFPGKNFRRARISQIKLIITCCHLNEVGQVKYIEEYEVGSQGQESLGTPKIWANENKTSELFFWNSGQRRGNLKEVERGSHGETIYKALFISCLKLSPFYFSLYLFSNSL